MKRYALIGHNISYSLSPLIHEVIFAKIGVDATYELLSASEDELPSLMEKLRSYDGFNITKPHKQNVLPYLTDNQLKSVNTVVVKDGKFYGYSTDGYGFMRDIALQFGSVSGKALILGAGGVARVIAYELKKAGMDVYVYNRTAEKARLLADELGVTACALDEVSADFIVNCTSCGFNRGENPACKNGKSENGLAVKTDKVKWVYDTIYSPPETDFLKSFEGVKKANGWGMLVLQGVQADRLLCDKEISEETEKEIYREILEKLAKKQGE